MAKSSLIAVLLVLTSITACKDRQERTLLPSNVKLEAGDVVLRCGSGITSNAVRFADKGGSYSHVGIVVDSAGQMMVVHAVPDEHDTPNDEDRVKMDHAETFFSSMRTDNGLVLRHNDSTKTSKAAQEAYRIYRKGMLFDHDYDDRDTSRMYCCELVEYAYRKAGVSIVGDRRHDINLPAMEFNHVMLPSDFVNSDRLTKIISF